MTVLHMCRHGAFLEFKAERGGCFPIEAFWQQLPFRVLGPYQISEDPMVSMIQFRTLGKSRRS